MKDLLVVVDMQEGFRSQALVSITSNIKKLLMNFRGEIIFLCFKNKRSSMFENSLKWKKFHDRKEQRIVKELGNVKSRKIFHTGYTIFDNALMGFVKKNEFKKVYLCGVYTDVCIIKAAMDAFDNGIKCRVIHDASNSPHGKNNHRFAVESLGHIIGKGNVVSVKDVIK